jgi:hypothetical protein
MTIYPQSFIDVWSKSGPVVFNCRRDLKPRGDRALLSGPIGLWPTAQANRRKPARHCEAHSPAGERHRRRATVVAGDTVTRGPGERRRGMIEK